MHCIKFRGMTASSDMVCYSVIRVSLKAQMLLLFEINYLENKTRGTK